MKNGRRTNRGTWNEAGARNQGKFGKRLLWLCTAAMVLVTAIVLGFLSQDRDRSHPSAHSTVSQSQVAKTASQPKQNPVAPSDDPDSLKPELTKFAVLIRQRQTGAARVQLHDYLQTQPDDGQATFLFGLTYHREQKYGQAITYYEDALKLAPEYANTHHFYGWALYYLGQLDEARSQFEEFLRFKPDEPDTLFGLGLIDLDEDNLIDARARFERSIEMLRAQKEIDPKDASKAHARLGEVFERRGDLNRAKEELIIATRIYPDAYEAFYRLYRVQVRMGEEAEAEQTKKQFFAAKERVRPGTSFPE